MLASRRHRRSLAVGLGVLWLAPCLARASENAATHEDPVALVALALAVILVVAKLGGDLATRVGQPAVLGELVAGVILGNLGLVGIGLFEPLKTDIHLDMLHL